MRRLVAPWSGFSLEENSEPGEAGVKGMERGGGGRRSWSMLPEIPSRLRHFPSQKQMVVPHHCALVLCPCFGHPAPIPFVHVSLSFCRVHLWHTVLRDCVPNKNNLKLELRLFISLPPGETEIGLNCSCHVLLHNSWVEITMKCFAEILRSAEKMLIAKSSLEHWQTQNIEKGGFRALWEDCCSLFSLYCSFVSSLTTPNKWDNIYIFIVGIYIYCLYWLLEIAYLFWNCLIPSLFIPMQGRLLWRGVQALSVTWAGSRGCSSRRWGVTSP